jgi:hypothetical protein
MTLMKKAIGYFFLAIFIIAVLAFVYFFVTKGYSGKDLNLSNIKETLVGGTPSPEPETVNEAGKVVSKKITLTITSPKDGATLNSTNVAIVGKTEPNAELFINDVEGKADSNGDFSISVGLEEGQNQLIIDANDDSGNVAEETLTVTVASF